VCGGGAASGCAAVADCAYSGRLFVQPEHCRARCQLGTRMDAEFVEHALDVIGGCLCL